MSTTINFPLAPGLPAPPSLTARPPHTPLTGRIVNLVPLQPDHAADLFEHFGGPDNFDRWTYLPPVGYPDYPSLEADVKTWSQSPDRQYYTILASVPGGSNDELLRPAGIIAYLNIEPGSRRLELGAVVLGKKLARTRAATEVSYLMLRRAFEEGYTRVEWKANNLNRASVNAALRLGFVAEGVFRKHYIVKGRYRDTAWFSMTDDEWPGVRRGLEAWLDDGNFDGDGRQKRTLQQCREDQ
ncbi:acyl-CoA N-acyltransferase [Dichotomopilus funicola]|uniref:Acyl-CoA N-acyltransferase n=1 Tax=Dichotomopilus funicola TaxID=1934379 RepID=A0AAN6UXI5_9PEZI|nr:acyl-CoA N-acyltransferase [Dichotomopilus funicola]